MVILSLILMTDRRLYACECICMYMCMCMYVYVYVCICYMYVCIYMYMLYACVCMYMLMTAEDDIEEDTNCSPVSFDCLKSGHGCFRGCFRGSGRRCICFSMYMLYVCICYMYVSII